jgi:hypothetical protein
MSNVPMAGAFIAKCFAPTRCDPCLTAPLHRLVHEAETWSRVHGGPARGAAGAKVKAMENEENEAVFVVNNRNKAC